MKINLPRIKPVNNDVYFYRIRCFAHINEFKKEENAAHNKFQEDVKKSKDRIVPKPPPQTVR